jgi:hypothetical protein
MNIPPDLSVAFVYQHYFTNELLVASMNEAREINRSRGANDWIHISTIDPVITLNRIVRAKGRERNKIIKELIEKP